MSSTVLVVDDVPSCRDPVAACLRKAGYRVFCASDVREGQHVLEDHSPDVVLLDLAMPGGSAIEWVEELRGEPRWRDLPVILLTGSGDARCALPQLRVEGVLIKSVAGIADIRAAIRKALRGKAESVVV